MPNTSTTLSTSAQCPMPSQQSSVISQQLTLNSTANISFFSSLDRRNYLILAIVVLIKVSAIVTITLELLKVLYRICRSPPILLEKPSTEM
ncbi:hypothetical protein [Nostoc sp. 2RC]|uniref:hypothetical protein n=1 Tax=Nostoc sp. 2RC TaxID=2485484 RepID=UPI001C891065|nr:hypothetical protein [Nostoc sp. 2RC]